MKKLLAALLVPVMGLTMISCTGPSAANQPKSPGEGLEFHLENDSDLGEFYALVGIGSCTDTDLIIPESYNDLPVAAIGDEALKDCTKLKSITIPDSVIMIMDYPFKGCTELTGITLPASVKYFETGALSGCANLKDITFTGTKAEWEALPKDEAWDDGTSDYTVHCTDGDIAKTR